MREDYCSVCFTAVDGDEAAILAISGAGVPRCLCAECAQEIETASDGREYNESTDAIGRLGKKLNDTNTDDPVVVDTMSEILKSAAERASLIKSGEYDFSKDENDSSDADLLEEIPEEMLETEEDRELDAADAERATRFDKFFNWVWAAMLIGSVAFLVWYFLLK